MKIILYRFANVKYFLFVQQVTQITQFGRRQYSYIRRNSQLKEQWADTIFEIQGGSADDNNSSIEHHDSRYWSHDESEYRYGNGQNQEDSANSVNVYQNEKGTEMLLFYSSIMFATTGYLLVLKKINPEGRSIPLI